MKNFKDLSGPKGWPILGSVLDYFERPLEFFEDAQKKYGDVVPIKMGPFKAFLLSHPNYAEDFFMKQAKHLIKSHALRTGAGVLGNGLLLSEGDFWRRQRRLAQPAFHNQKIASYAPDMLRLTEAAIEDYKRVAKSGEQIEVHSSMMRLTLAIASRTLFSRDITGPESEVVAAGLGDVLEWWNTHFMYPAALQKFPTPSRIKFNQGVKALNELVYTIIEDRQKTGIESHDFLGMLMKAQDEDGSKMTNEQLRDEVITLLLAGHETTANMLTWAFYLLSQHPEHLQKLEQELDRVLGKGTAARAPGPGDLAQLPFLDQVIQETLRLYPPAWSTGREAIQDVQIGEYHFPKGTNFFVSMWVLHHDSRFFENPYDFMPERWTPEFKAKLPKYSFVPFGGGPRACIGSGFAMLEAVIILARIVSQIRLKATPGLKLTPTPQITLRPAEKVWMSVESRV